MTDVAVMWSAFAVAAFVIAVGWMCYACGKHVKRQNIDEIVAAAVERGKAEERLHRTNLLRERGRITDVHPGATGPPATVHRMRVLGMRPEGQNKPPTRM